MIGVESKAERSLVWKGKVIDLQVEKPVEKNEIDSIRKKEQKKVETEYEYYSEDDDAQEISKIWQHGKLLPITNKDEPLENLKVLSPLFQKQSAPQHRPTSFYS